MHYKNYFFVLFTVLLFNSCSQHEKPAVPTLFTRLTGDQSGILFNNRITEAPGDSTLILEFAYMGGGVGIAAAADYAIAFHVSSILFSGTNIRRMAVHF